jgi:hypothetical protein
VSGKEWEGCGLLEAFSRHLSGGTKKIHHPLSQDSQYLDQDPNPAPPFYKRGTLHVYQHNRHTYWLYILSWHSYVTVIDVAPSRKFCYTYVYCKLWCNLDVRKRLKFSLLFAHVKYALMRDFSPPRALWWKDSVTSPHIVWCSCKKSSTFAPFSCTQCLAVIEPQVTAFNSRFCLGRRNVP